MPKPISPEVAASLLPRILRHVRILPNGCWDRTRYVNPVTGYTSIALTRGARDYYLAHRVTYTYKHGPIPDELEIDHLCRNRACCNPDHLEPVTHRENLRRSPIQVSTINSLKEKCSKGHPLVRAGKGYTRKCATCTRVANKRRREERRAQGVPADEPHGTKRAYDHWCCRCDECRAGARQRYLDKKATA